MFSFFFLLLVAHKDKSDSKTFFASLSFLAWSFLCGTRRATVFTSRSWEGPQRNVQQTSWNTFRFYFLSNKASLKPKALNGDGSDSVKYVALFREKHKLPQTMQFYHISANTANRWTDAKSLRKSPKSTKPWMVYLKTKQLLVTALDPCREYACWHVCCLLPIQGRKVSFVWQSTLMKIKTSATPTKVKFFEPEICHVALPAKVTSMSWVFGSIFFQMILTLKPTAPFPQEHLV